MLAGEPQLVTAGGLLDHELDVAALAVEQLDRALLGDDDLLPVLLDRLARGIGAGVLGWHLLDRLLLLQVEDDAGGLQVEVRAGAELALLTDRDVVQAPAAGLEQAAVGTALHDRHGATRQRLPELVLLVVLEDQNGLHRAVHSRGAVVVPVVLGADAVLGPNGHVDRVEERDLLRLALADGAADGDGEDLHLPEALVGRLAHTAAAAGAAGGLQARHRRHRHRVGREALGFLASVAGDDLQLRVLERGARVVGDEHRTVPGHDTARLVVDPLVVRGPAEAERLVEQLRDVVARLARFDLDGQPRGVGQGRRHAAVLVADDVVDDAHALSGDAQNDAVALDGDELAGDGVLLGLERAAVADRDRLVDGRLQERAGSQVRRAVAGRAEGDLAGTAEGIEEEATGVVLRGQTLHLEVVLPAAEAHRVLAGDERVARVDDEAEIAETRGRTTPNAFLTHGLVPLPSRSRKSEVDANPR